MEHIEYYYHQDDQDDQSDKHDQDQEDKSDQDDHYYQHDQHDKYDQYQDDKNYQDDKHKNVWNKYQHYWNIVYLYVYNCLGMMWNLILFIVASLVSGPAGDEANS